MAPIASPRRVLLAGAALQAAPRLARAAGFPDRPLRMIIPWAPGGSTDAQLRSLCEIAGRHLGQPIVVENRPGARGTFGAQMLLQARPDGYTLAQLHSAVLSHPYMTRATTWDPVEDFQYIIALTGYLSGLVVRQEAPWATWQALMADARARPNAITYGTSGIGGLSHLVMSQLLPREGVEMLHVPYRGVAETTTALLSGTVDSVADSSGWAPHVEVGRMRLLAIWANDRARRFPQAPTIKELGHDIGGIAPYGLAAPRGTDPGVVRVLHDAFKAALYDPAHLAVLDRYDMPNLYMNGDDYRAWVAARVPVERDLVQRLGIRLD